ncbi:AAA domain-containing protein [Durusdinium trenchii]|uniref:AAA domain-containing protein n=1 Tax=Durusdinium trenchii TaxID=1381693 RepID=A0ABP0LFX4_9DINO
MRLSENMTSSENAPAVVPQDAAQERLDVLLSRIHELTATGDESPATMPVTPIVENENPPSAPPQQAARAPVAAGPMSDQRDNHGDWFPSEPENLRSARLTESEVEDLLLKILNARSEASGRDLAEQVKLPFRLIDPMLQQMKQDQMVAHRGASVMNDYIYQLTNKGRERAKKLTEHCTYLGAAPVTLEHYIDSVTKQTMADQHPSEEDLHRAFDDLLIDKRMLLRLGPAINSGRGLFLYGAPGNGKTSIAERVTKAFGEYVWIPRALGIDGEVMRLYDPSMHEPAPEEDFEGLLDNRKIDNRWVRIRRPTIVVGGELTMDSLEVTLNTATNVSEAPVQLKSNCGTLVIDDFGRQRMTTDELLNRWIVPLEKRYDFLNLASGKKIQVPFDQLIIFSTNLEPKDLVDDAFLRRIPYKIEVTDPEETAFRELFKIMAPIIGVDYDQTALDYLVATHYKAVSRPMRCCQPRDLLLQIKNFCHYVKRPAVMTNENLDFAVENYFAVM